MKILIKGRNIQVTEALDESISRKLSKLDKYFSSELEAHVTLRVEKNDQIIEVAILFNGIHLRAEERNEDLYVAIDLVVDKLYKQIRKQKTKLLKRHHDSKEMRSSILFDNIESYEGSVQDDESIIKVKKFSMKPMFKDEAILQMELIGHDFYVFKNAETNEVNVLYKRKSGNYGLIEGEE